MFLTDVACVYPHFVTGFSGYFPRPSYQEHAVAPFLANLGDTYAGLFNASGRGFPDIAAQAHNVEIITGGETVYINGTSCSGPIFASMVALVNDRLIAVGRPSLGFLNPLCVTCGSRTLTGLVAEDFYLAFIITLRYSPISRLETLMQDVSGYFS